MAGASDIMVFRFVDSASEDPATVVAPVAVCQGRCAAAARRPSAGGREAPAVVADRPNGPRGRSIARDRAAARRVEERQVAGHPSKRTTYRRVAS
jgi:hypothetical protein